MKIKNTLTIRLSLLSVISFMILALASASSIALDHLMGLQGNVCQK